jgi:uracil-DNA glycosylase
LTIMPLGTFPFGQPVREVVQTDRTAKRVFVLGVYASAVHARWIGPNGKILVNALAVASEPYIFWRGEDAAAIIETIKVPPALGKLEPAASQYNGPSGRALDELILEPLRSQRAEAWLCDLVPHSCVNASQEAAIKRVYARRASKYDLAKHSVPPIPKPLINNNRRQAILAELRECGASTLILLGDQPIRWFLAHFETRWKKLADFIDSGRPYGQTYPLNIAGQSIRVLPIAHPRQIARLGQASSAWYDRHQAWMSSDAEKILSSYQK